MTVEALQPVTLNGGYVRYAPAVKAGRWVFLTGHMATDHRSGLAPDVLRPRLPHTLPPRHEREGRAIFARMTELLHAAGSSFAHAVRIDQYFTTVDAVAPYHRARRDAFAGHSAPSTSIIQRGLLLPDAAMDVQLVAVMPGSGLDPRRIAREGLVAPAASGYSPAICAGDYVFVAGQLARDASGTIPPEARLPGEQLWQGTRIALETDYLIRERLRPALEAAGSSLRNVIKAQIYLADIGDTAEFLDVWGRHFGATCPALTVLPAEPPGFGTRDSRLEVNAIALRDDGETRGERVDAGGFTGLDHQPGAVRAGDLLLLSGLMATDGDGLVAGGDVDPRQPWFGSPAEAQMAFILERAAAICERAGTSLENVVRVQQFHTDLADFYPAWHAWQKVLPGRALPISAIGIPPALPVPGARVVVDLWVHAP